MAARKWPSAPERFWAKVNKDGPAPDYAPHLGPCWLWTGWINPAGYGEFRADRRYKAHRYAYILSISDPGADLQLDHLCRVRHCVNPAHLEPVTQRENLLRGTGWSARSAAATHCPRGHEYNATNTGITPAGHRRCNVCAREREAAKWAAKSPEERAAQRARERETRLIRLARRAEAGVRHADAAD